MIKVLLVDDHGIIRDALRYLLEAHHDIEVVATASDGQEAVEKTALYRPDIVIMDVSMPRMDGIEATRQICTSYPATRVVVLTMYNTPEHMQHALQAGASSYILKDAAGQDLVTAVRTVQGGGRYFSPGMESSDETTGSG